LVLKEIVQDDLSGDWIERVSNLELQEWWVAIGVYNFFRN
jgi:hypothetical protein